MGVLKNLSDLVQGKRSIGDAKRSSQWGSVRAKHLVDHGSCAACGGTDKLEVHHKVPFHVHQELELDPTNLITLCESSKGGITCHLFIGHLSSYKSWNVDVDKDAQYWLKKVQIRPTLDNPDPE